MNPDKLKKFFDMENRTKYFVSVLSYLLVASVVVFALLIIGGNSLGKKTESVVEKSNPFENIHLEGKGVVVYDVINSRELFSKNPDLPLPLASLTKVLTAIVTNEKLEDNQNVKITTEYLEPEGDSKLIVGDIWRAVDLRDFTLLTSSNDGAFALASVAEAKDNSTETQFIKEMNETAYAIGLTNSKFFNEHGLDRPARLASESVAGGEEDIGGAYGSAKDMAVLFEYTLRNYPQILEATRYKNLQFNSAEATYSGENTNILVDKIPGLLASKTGFTDLAGGNLVVAFDAGLNRPIIISVLGSTEEGRFSDVLQLVQATFAAIR